MHPDHVVGHAGLDIGGRLAIFGNAQMKLVIANNGWTWVGGHLDLVDSGGHRLGCGREGEHDDEE